MCNSDPERLALVFSRNLKSVHGWTVSTDGVAGGIKDAGDAAMALEARRELKRMLLELAEGL